MWGRGSDRGVRRLAGLILVAGVGLALPGLARAQVAASALQQPGDRQSCGGIVVGSLGITRMDCRGDCTLSFEDGWRDGVWSFSVEPRITEIAPHSPAARALEIGDRIVAIDGILITTTEGGRRFASIEPDRDVTIRYRRDGRVGDTVLRSGTRCGPAVEGVRTIPPFSWSGGPTALDTVSVKGESWAGPGILIMFRNSPEGRRTTMNVPGVSQSDERTVALGRLGMNTGCGPCGSTSRDGRQMWFFSNPIDVIGIHAGGPADRAGVRVGDRITHVNGFRIQSRRGADAFSILVPGRAIQVTVVGRDGRERTVTVVPAGRDD